VTIAWSASDAGGAGIESYDLWRSVDGAAFAAVVNGVSEPVLAVTLPPGHSYRFEVRARDRAGNVGSWVAGPTIRTSLLQETSSAITWTGSWATGAGTAYSGGTVRSAAVAGASATYAFTGRSVAWVTNLCVTCGVARVYVDGALVATIDLHAAGPTFRRVVFSRTWSSSGSHTIRIVVAGTVGHARVDLDALEILR